jgi:UPF0716 family protein affecting phage T7 exclusion
MIKGYIIIIASLWLIFPKVICAETALTGFLDASTRTVIQHVESTLDAEIIFAQNNKNQASDGVRGHGIETADEDATQPKTLTQEKNAPEKAGQLKPFTPTETIPADQGVDFPYDI